MKILLLAIALLVSALVLRLESGWSSYVQIVGPGSLWLLGFAVLRLMWLNAKTIAGIAGRVAAKGANHADNFKEAFKDARNK